MGQTRTDEFRKDAVGIALTSGLTRKQIASDLGVGMSTLSIALRSPPRGCIFHRCAARSSQYCSHDYQKILRQHGFAPGVSMPSLFNHRTSTDR